MRIIKKNLLWLLSGFKRIVNYTRRLRLKTTSKGNLSLGKCFINQKVRVNGKGTVIIGDGCIFGGKITGRFHGPGIEIQARYKDSIIEIGNRTAFNNNLLIHSAKSVKIGENCRIGENVTVIDFEAHGTLPEKRSKLGKKGTVVIGNNVWIGNSSIILKNVTIGENSIVAAGSVVLKGDYPSNSIVGGNPAKVIRSI